MGLLSPASAELELDRSRFLALAFPVESEDAFNDALAQRRTEHPRARHHVWAWRLGDAAARYSDDGEPQGTGGPPLLSLLEAEGLAQAALIVTRYFGGSLLGRARLLRTYRQAAADALGAAPKGRLASVATLVVHIPWEAYPRVQHHLAEGAATIQDTLFSEKVRLTLRLPSKGAEHMLQTLRDLTRGAVVLEGREDGVALVPLEHES